MQDPGSLLKADRKLEGIWASTSIAAQVKLQQQEPRSPLSEDDSDHDDSSGPSHPSPGAATAGATAEKV